MRFQDADEFLLPSFAQLPKHRDGYQVVTAFGTSLGWDGEQEDEGDSERSTEHGDSLCGTN